MDLERLLEALVAAAERAGVRVRVEPFDPALSDVRRPRGGLCVLRGQPVILVDANLPLPDRAATMAEALTAVDLDHLYMAPAVRAAIDRASRARTHEMRPLRASPLGRPPLALVRTTKR